MIKVGMQMYNWVYRINKMKIRQSQVKSDKAKLLALFTVPFLILTVVSYLQIVRLSDHAGRISDLENLNRLAIYMSDLVHELQRERGIVGIYLSSEGTRFIKELEMQRQRTDRSRDSVVRHMSSSSRKLYSEKFIHLMSSSNEQLGRISIVRHNVDRLRINVSAGIQYYTKLNSTLLDAVGVMANESVEPELTRDFLAYVNFLKGKEKAGIERAILGITFTKNVFYSNEDYQMFVGIIAQQNQYFREFSSLANERLLKAYTGLTESPVYSQVDEFRNIAHIGAFSGDFNVDPAAWFNVVTIKINKLKSLEDRISRELLRKSNKLHMESGEEKWLWVVFLTFIILLVIFVGAVLIRNINISFSRRLNEYQELFENFFGGVAVIDLESADLLHSNIAFSDMTGYSREELSRMNFADLHPCDEKDKVCRIFKRLEAGWHNPIENIQLKNKDGSKFVAEVSSFPITIGKRNCLAANVRDISARLETEEKLHKSEQTLRTVLDSLDFAVAVLDIECESTIYLNNQALELFNQRAGAEPLWRVLDPPPFKSLDFDQTSSGLEFTEQFYSKTRRKWYQVRNRIIPWHDGRTVCIRMLQDVTDRYDSDRKNKNLLVENRKLSLRNYNLQEAERKKLSADLHDQLGQLMTGILLQADYVCHRLSDKDQLLTTATKKISGITRELISSVQIITNKLRPVLLDQLGLPEALADLVQEWKNVGDGILFKCDIDEFLDEFEDHVNIALFRILQESLTNIHKHSCANTASVSLRLEQRDDIVGACSVLLQVSDNGIGFENEGTQFDGMGLLNMRERTEALGGVFRLVSTAGKGVDVLVSNPVKLS